MREPAAPHRLLLSRAEAAAALGVGLRTFDRLESAGKIGPRPVKLGGSIRYSARALDAWIASAVRSELPDREQWSLIQKAESE